MGSPTENWHGPTVLSATNRQRFSIADWIIDPSTDRMEKGRESHKLEPKVMSLLVYLAERQGQLVSRSDIEDNVWRDVVVGYDTVTGAIQKLRKAFGDNARNPQIIETVSKKGYRLLAPVELALPSHSPTYIFRKSALTARISERWFLTSLAAFLLVALGYLGWFQTADRHVTKPETIVPVSSLNAIAVLPFENLGGSAEQDYFADGFTEDLITDLSRLSGLTVIARSSTFAYKNKSLDVRRIAKELGARYVVEGSVRKTGRVLRLNAQLIDGSNGHHIWAERYDGQLGELFSLQNQIAKKIASALAVTITQSEEQILARDVTDNTEAYELFLQGRNLFQRFSKEDTYRSRSFFEKAIELDPKFAQAYATLAWTFAFEYSNAWSEAPELTLEKALKLADKALALNDQLPVAYFVRGLVFRERHGYIKALAEAQKSIEIDPNYANGHVLLATLLYYAGQPEEGLRMVQKAARLHPRHPSQYPFHMGQALFILERYDEAISAFKHGLTIKPSSQRLRVWLAATYAQVGKQEDAEWEASQVLTSDPNFSLKRLPQAFPFKDPAQLQRIIGALRKAGFKGDL